MYRVLSVLIFTAGLGCFLRGFFLTRREVELSSECDLGSLASHGKVGSDLLKHVSESLDDKEGHCCWSPRYHDRVFMFVIDALRVDFVTEENMPFLHGLIAKNATQTRFFNFRADPPTTTSQRLKGITTGSLPTFIDISSNFESAAIQEDNWVDIFYRERERTRSMSEGKHHDDHSMRDRMRGRKKKKKKKSIFLGDDTWPLLYPTQFDISKPFDSFNTRDLDTVDDGIERHLWPLLAAHAKDGDEDQGEDQGEDDKDDWGLFVVHFLGVDHIGHTHSAFHPLMRSRLRRMDQIAERLVTKELPEDAILLLFGDHGMTDDGNHGGASTEETDAAMVVYSKHAHYHQQHHHTDTSNSSSSKHAASSTEEEVVAPKVVAQIDLVPTLSLLLGHPIPYSSLGAFIPELLPSLLPNSGLLLAQTYLVNALQVHRYLKSYSNSNSGSTGGTLANVAEKLSSGLEGALNAHTALLMLSATGTANTGDNDESDGADNGREPSWDTVNRLYAAYLADAADAGRSAFTTFNVPLMVAGLVLCGIAVYLAISTAATAVASDSVAVVQSKTKATGSIVYCTSAAVLGSLHAISSISDTCIHYEHQLLLASATTLMVLITLFPPSTTYLHQRCGVKRAFLLLLLGLGALCGLWLCNPVHAAEIRGSLSPLLFPPALGAEDSSMGQVRTSLAIGTVCMCLFMRTSYKWRVYIPPRLRVLLAVSIATCILYHNHENIMHLQHTHRCTIATVGGDTAQSCDGEEEGEEDERVWEWVYMALGRVCIACCALGIPYSYMHRRDNEGRSSHSALLFMAVLVVLATGRNSAMAMWFAFVQWLSVSSLAVTGSDNHNDADTTAIDNDNGDGDGDGDGDTVSSSSPSPFLSGALAIHAAGIARLLFFCTEHRMDFSSLHLEAGFVGMPTFSFYWAGTMLAINTFGPMLIGLFCALDSTVTTSSRRASGEDHGTRHRRVIVSWYGAYHMLLTASSSITAFVLRRHLMVWAVFAPKLAFEACLWLAICAPLLLMR